MKLVKMATSKNTYDIRQDIGIMLLLVANM